MNKEYKASKLEDLAILEELSEKGQIDILYGDESHFCSEGYVPRGWQFAGEDVSIKVEKRFRLNCLALVSRGCNCFWQLSKKNIDSHFVIDFLDAFVSNITRITFIVLDNASIHRSKAMRAKIKEWQERGLYIFFLPTYSPEYNIAETLWRVLKTLELRPQDYKTEQALTDRLTERMDSLGDKWEVKYGTFNHK